MKPSYKLFVLSSIIIFLWIGGLSAYSQPNKRTNNWYYHKDSGLDFNSGNPVVISDWDGSNTTWAAISTMSDTNGNLLFFSDGYHIWNKEYEIMYDDHPFWNASHQAALSVPKPGSDNLFYIFTAKYIEHSDHPMFYYVVDMSANNGLGEVIEIDSLYAGWDASTLVTGTYHKNKTDIWVLTRKFVEEKYAAFLVSENGVDPNPVLSPAPHRPLDDSNFGYMKVSYDKKYIVTCFWGDSHNTTLVEINTFDHETGAIEFLYSFRLSDYISLPPYTSLKTGNLEFSPCSKFLYIGAYKFPGDLTSYVYQFDMQHIEDSAQFLETFIQVGDVQGGNLQLAPDGKIYCFQRGYLTYYPYTNWIGVIHDPGKPGTACNYEADHFFVDHGRVRFSFVNFFTDFLFRFDFDGICESDTFYFDPWFFPEPTYIEWNFGDPLSGMTNTSTIPHATHKFTDGGIYEVSVHVEYPGGRIEETSRKVEVEFSPEPDLGPDTSFCNQIAIMLDATCGPHSYFWSTGATSSQINVSDTGWYWVMVESEIGCIGFDSIHIGLLSAITADTNGLQVTPATCGGNNGSIKGLVITGVEPITYRWTDGLGNLISDSLDIYNLSAGEYTLEITDSNNCVTTLGPYSIPDIGDVLIQSVAYSQEYCNHQNGSITVTAVSGFEEMLVYSIDGGATFLNNLGIFPGLSAGSYTVIVRDSSGCQSEYAYNPVIIQNTDAPEINMIIIGFCAVGQSNGYIEISATGGGDTLFYSIDNGQNFQINDGGFYNLSAGQYNCMVMDELGCDTTFIVEVTEELTIHLQAKAGYDEVCPGNTAFVPLYVSNFNDVADFKTTLLYDKDFLTCTGFANAHAQLEDSLVALMTPAEGKIELNWSSTAISLPDSTLMVDLIFESIDPGTSLVDWNGSAGASIFHNSTGLTIPVDYFAGNVKIFQLVIFTLNSTFEACQGDMLELIPTLWSSNGEVSYLWVDPSGTEFYNDTLIINNLQQHHAGAYSLRITDTLDCFADATSNILIHPAPVPSFTGQDTIKTDHPIELDGGNNYFGYQWSTGETSQYISADHSGWYSVVMESLEGCYGEDSVYVLFLEPIEDLLFLPNAFTPNADGLNDEFTIINPPANLESFKMNIYNRWGQLLFENKDITAGWDGMYKGGDAPAGVYVYKIEYSIGIYNFEETGTLMLVR